MPTIQSGRRTEGRYYPALDGLRAVSVFLVMFNHVHADVPGWIRGWLGVDVFFVLSGFLITSLMLAEKARSGSISLRGFYARRFFRIVPVYVFTIALYFAAVHASHDQVKADQLKAALPWLLTFLQEYRPALTGNVLGHAWTLGIEEKFYLVWPLLVLILYPFRVPARLCIAALFGSILLLPHMYARSYDGLLIGAMTAIALTASGRSRLKKAMASIPDAVLALLLVGTYVLSAYGERFVLFFSCAVALLVASVVLRDGMIRRGLAFAPLVFVGKRSYAMYLIHVLALNMVEKLSPPLLGQNALATVCVAYAVSLAGASAMYAAIERPSIVLGRQLSRHWTERRGLNLQVPAVE